MEEGKGASYSLLNYSLTMDGLLPYHHPKGSHAENLSSSKAVSRALHITLCPLCLFCVL